MGYVVDELFAFIATDEDGDEGVMAAQVGDTWYPLVAADLVRVQQYVPLAIAASNAAGVEYKLKHFQLIGDVSNEYLEQFKDLAKPSDEDDVPGDEGDDEPEPDGSGRTNGGTPDHS